MSLLSRVLQGRSECLSLYSQTIQNLVALQLRSSLRSQEFISIILLLEIWLIPNNSSFPLLSSFKFLRMRDVSFQHHKSPYKLGTFLLPYLLMQESRELPFEETIDDINAQDNYLWFIYELEFINLLSDPNYLHRNFNILTFRLSKRRLSWRPSFSQFPQIPQILAKTMIYQICRTSLVFTLHWADATRVV